MPGRRAMRAVIGRGVARRVRAEARRRDDGPTCERSIRARAPAPDGAEKGRSYHYHRIIKGRKEKLQHIPGGVPVCSPTVVLIARTAADIS